MTIFRPYLLVLLLACAALPAHADEPEPGEDGPTLPPANGTVGAALNADNIELKNLLDIVSQRTGRRFVISEEIGARKVSIISFSEIPDGNIYPLLLSVLDTMHLSVVDKGGAMHVLPLPPGELVGIPDALGGDADAGGMELRVIPLKHTSATELRRAIQPLVRGGDIGGLGAFGPTNHLLVMETRQRLDLIQEIIEQLDQEGSGRLIEVIPLKHASAEEIAREVTSALSGMETVGTRISRRVQQATGGELDLPTGNLVIPSPQSNSLILVGAPVDIAEARRIIEKLDVASASGSGRHRVIKLKYASAEELAKSLEGLFSKSAGKDEARRIAVEPVISANALLVDANPLDYDNLKVLIDTLDVEPQQVLVEVLIAEMADTDSLDLGVEWATIDAPRDGSTTAIGRSRPGETDAIRSLLTDLAFSQGLSLGVARGTFTDAAGNIQPRIPFLLRAVAGNRKVSILSKPALVAQNNKKAVVSVVDNIPILRSTIQGGGGSTRDIVQNIEREDVGLTLTFTRTSPQTPKSA
jgi:general secretion pathway protein D